MMKNNLIYTAFALGVLAFANSSCEDANNAAIDNLVYFSEAATAKTKVLTLKSQDVSTSLTIRLAKAIGTDVNVTIAIDESILTDYNARNETDYRAVDAANLDFLNTATISAGSVSAEPLAITVHPFEADGVQYAVPISITEVEGAVEKAESSSKFIFILEQPLIQPVPTFQQRNHMKAEPTDEDWGLVLPNYTLEWWCKMSGFSINNQAIFSFNTDSELYIRFGDEIYGRWVYNFLQVKAMGSQFDTGNPNEGKGLSPNTWYHFAVTYDASTGTTVLYKDGELISTLSTEVGKPLTINGLQMISSGSPYFWDRCEMCQVRLWKVTRSVNQIKANMNKAVDPSNNNLLFYLPMNEGEGSTLHDTSGNGHNVSVGNVGGLTTVNWNTYSFGD